LEYFFAAGTKKNLAIKQKFFPVAFLVTAGTFKNQLFVVMQAQWL
jgi:hypothetical protein